MSSIAWSISSAVCCHIHRESASEHLQGQGSDTQLRVEHSAMDCDFGWATLSRRHGLIRLWHRPTIVCCGLLCPVRYGICTVIG